MSAHHWTLKAVLTLALAIASISAIAASDEDREWARSVGDAMSFEQDENGGIFSPEGGDASKINEETTGVEPESEQEAQLLERGEDSYGKDGKLEEIGRNTSDKWEANSPDTSSGTAFDIVTGSMSSEDGTREMESHGCTITRNRAENMVYDPNASIGNRVKGDGYQINEDTCQENYTGRLNSECRLVSDTFECIQKDNSKVVRTPVNVRTNNYESIGFKARTSRYSIGPVEYNYTNNVWGYTDRMRWRINIPVDDYPEKDKVKIQIKHGNRVRFEGSTSCSGSYDCTSTITNLTGDRSSNNGVGGRGYKESRLIGYNSSASFSSNGVVSLFAEHRHQLNKLKKSSKNKGLKIKSIRIIYNGSFDDSKYEPGDLEKCSNKKNLHLGELCDEYDELKLTADVAKKELDPLWDGDPQTDACWKAGIKSVCERQVEETDPYLDSVVEGAWDEQAIEEEFLKMAGGCTTKEVTETSESTLEYTEEGFCTIPQDMEIEGCSINRNIELDGDGNIVTDAWEGSSRCKDLMTKIEDYQDTCDFNLDYNEPGMRTIDGHDVMTCSYAQNHADASGLFEGGFQTASLFPTAQAADAGCPDSHPIKVTHDIASDFPHIGYDDVGKCVSENSSGGFKKVASFNNMGNTNTGTVAYDVLKQLDADAPYVSGNISLILDKKTKYRRVSSYIKEHDITWYAFEILEGPNKGAGIDFGVFIQGMYPDLKKGNYIQGRINGYRTLYMHGYVADVDIFSKEGCPSGYEEGDSSEYQCLSTDMKSGCAIYRNLQDHGYPGNKITERVEVSQISCGPDSLQATEQVCNDAGECIEPGQSIGPATQEDTCQQYRERGCTRKSDECVNEVQHPLGGTHCVEREQRYECEIVEEHSNEVTMDEYDCGDKGEFYCLDGNCVEDPKGENSSRFGEAAARITAAEGIASHTECANEDDPSTCQVFGGEAVACREGSGPLADLWNCCDVAASGGSGSMDSEDWARMAINASAIAAGVSFEEMPFESSITQQVADGAIMAGMAAAAWDMAGQFMTLLISCHDEEFQLAHAKQVNQATYIGRRCGESISVGFDEICVRRDYHYCKFDSLMSKVIMEQAVGQLGRTLGTAENPNCGGMTIDEVANLDWDKINLDEWEAQLRKSDMLNAPTMGDSNTDSSLPESNPGDAPNWD